MPSLLSPSWAALRAAHRARIPSSLRHGPVRPMLWRRPFAAAAGVLFLLNALMLAVGAGGGPAGVGVAALVALPVGLCPYRPMAAWWAMLTGLLVATPFTMIVGQDALPPWFLNLSAAQLPVLYALALSVPLGVVIPALAVTLSAGVLAVALIGGAHDTVALTQGALIWSLELILTVVLGHTRRARSKATLRIAEERGLRDVLEERARIARDLHDVVAHHMSVIAVQAATAPYRLGEDMSAAVAAEFDAINAAARSSLGELRQLLGVLRDPSAGWQGIAEVPALAASVRSAGLPLRLELPEPPPALPPEVSQAAYRIVQEALSNVVRHATGAPTTVCARLDEEGGRLVIEVTNERPPSAVSPAASGHGLEGMRERASALGGSFAAGPDGDGGFAVRAVLPVGSTTAAGEDHRTSPSARGEKAVG
ncbi:sensor histidine kinase [Nonomuraea sp. bgisy101]|uniref:sensor histidine kinase n=1 Tax=Nonomuraea sp. bgisy101 TaxID=3413784 RepID=UPI003D74C596